MMEAGPKTEPRRMTTVRWIGVCLGFVISIGLLFTIFLDRTARTDAEGWQGFVTKTANRSVSI